MSAWYVFGMLVLTAYRVTRLVIRDDLPPLLWARDRLVGGWRKPTPAEWKAVRAERSKYRTTVRNDQTLLWTDRKPWVPGWLAELLSCPWCVSAYVAGALTAVTDVTVGVPVPWLTAVAVWAGAAMLASRETL